MADKKKSFIVYHDYEKHLRRLTLEQKGLILDAMFILSEYGEINEEGMTEGTSMAFSFIANQMERDNQAYIDKCKKNQDIATKGWEKRKKEANAKEKIPEDANACERILSDAKYADNDNDNDNDTDNDKDIYKEYAVASAPKEKKEKKFIYPSNKELSNALKDLEEFRKKSKKPMTDKAKSLIISKLEKLHPGNIELQIKSIEQTIENGWTGVFAVKGDNGNDNRINATIGKGSNATQGRSEGTTIENNDAFHKRLAAIERKNARTNEV